MNYRIICLLLNTTFGLLVGCQSIHQGPLELSNSDLLIINQPVNYTSETILDKEVVLYPGAMISTGKQGKVIFKRRVTVLGESQVFDENVQVEFLSGTLSELNPCWFGAKGDDQLDDTKAIQKVMDIGRVYASSINIEFPLGKYLISTTLQLGNNAPSEKSINLIGKSMSSNALSGSSLQWVGKNGGVLLQLQNYCVGQIENLDFNKGADRLLKYNVALKPFDYQVEFKNCSFAGCGGPGSANVNLNQGNNLQVSEISFDNCEFRGYSADGETWETEAGVIGGLANTKNFYFRFCSMVGYTQGAIDLEVTDALKVENCTFAHNKTDIVCLVCNTLATSNYSEHSESFFRSSVSFNVSFTTLMDNCFYGTGGQNYIIPEGGGHLVLINNNFGGMGGDDLRNLIRWDSGPFSHVFSIGNFYRNAPPLITPFEFTGQLNDLPIQTLGDLIGRTADDIEELKPILSKNQH